MSEIIFHKGFEGFEEKLKKKLKGYFPGNSIAIKLHMGEVGNKNYLKPEFVKKFVDVLNELGYKPFLFDSPAVYHGQRDTVKKYEQTAKDHGFFEEKIGCPIVISDEPFTVKMQHSTYGVCKPLVEADGVLVLTHVKGHICSGFGGAIKNLGMGALTKASKGMIHMGGEPEYIGNCQMCGECAKACPLENIRHEDNRPYFDGNWCSGCSNCVYACKHGAIKPKLNYFDLLLAEGAFAALKNFKKAFFVNVLVRISQKCDCVADAGPILCDDIGILMGEDIVAIDKASLDFIKEKAGKDVFLESNKKSPMKHIEFAEKMG